MNGDQNGNTVGNQSELQSDNTIADQPESGAAPDSQVEASPINSTAHDVKTGMSATTKWLLGCGCGCGGLVVLFIAACIGGWMYGMSYVNGIVEELESKGFNKVRMQQVVVVGEPAKDKDLYVGQVVKITNGAEGDLAIVAQIAEISGKVNGKVYFRGQILKVMPGAEITNGLDVKAQIINDRGSIKGDITGTYQSKTDQALPY